jgi:glucose/arabinose dehydrogenase
MRSRSRRIPQGIDVGRKSLEHGEREGARATYALDVRRAFVLASLTAVLASCNHPQAAPDLTKVRVRLVRIGDLEGALALAVRSSDDALYIAQRGGQIRAIRGGQLDPTPVLDVSDRISTRHREQGLLGLAFSPDGRILYVDYTDTNDDTNVVEYTVQGNRVVPSSARRVLLVRQPYRNHNGGNLVFGPDGFLYVGLGDGGSHGDPHRNGQNVGVLLGKILRIDPRPHGAAPYGIPSDNPFVGRADVRPEIWAYGLRNPWRFEFDRQTGDLWIADVGWSDREEIDRQPAGSRGGQNYGWVLLEGTLPHSDNIPAGTVPPTYEYEHTMGRCAVTGGYVYRGSAIPDLRGSYVFGDFCQGTLMALRYEGGKVTMVRSLGVSVEELSSFGEDARGELYALSLAGSIYRIVPAS